MKVFDQTKSLSLQITQWKRDGELIGFVPTMGNLHEGHLSLVKESQSRASKTIVSIFVNPLQFGPQEDFSAYPRTLEHDLQLLKQIGVDAVFTPSDREMYPEGFQTTVKVGKLADNLCGAFRPGHFDGVCTVVLKLVHLIQADLLILGEKDFQQLQILRTCFRDLNHPVHILSGATLREPDGLAMSSRNRRLPALARERAPYLHRTMAEAVQRVLSRQESMAVACQRGREHLEMNGFAVQYFEFRRETDLERSENLEGPHRLFAAAVLSGVRLIDNLPLRDDSK